MSVEFNEEGSNYAQIQKAAEEQPASKMVLMVIKYGLASDEDSANKLLLGVAVCSFLLTIFVIFKFIL